MCLLQAWLLYVSTPQRNPGFSSKVLVSVPWISWCNAVWSIVVVKSCSSEDREKKKNRKNKKREGACLWLFSLPPFFFFYLMCTFSLFYILYHSVFVGSRRKKIKLVVSTTGKIEVSGEQWCFMLLSFYDLFYLFCTPDLFFCWLFSNYSHLLFCYR